MLRQVKYMQRERAPKNAVLTKRRGDVCHQSDNECCVEKFVGLTSQSDHEISDCCEQNGNGDENRNFRNRFAEKVNVCPVHSICIFSHENW